MSDDLIEAVKSNISCRMFAEHIGLNVNRNGYCCCPFHGEKTPSLKIYPNEKGWYCFGCHAGGDVINMAKLYYDTSFRDAVNRLASEFGLQPAENGLKSDSNGLLSAVKRAKAKSLKESKERLKSALEAEYWASFDKWLANERIIGDYAPKSLDEEFDEKFVYAITHREELRFQLEDAEMRRNKLYGCE